MSPNQSNSPRIFVEAQQRSQKPIPAVLQSTEPNPLQRAFDDYHRMEEELRVTKEKNQSLLVENANLLSEAQMLRDLVDKVDADRVRLQAFSSTLLGRLYAINDCIAGAVKASIKEGVDAASAMPVSEEAGRTASEAAEATQSAPSPQPSDIPETPGATPRPPVVEWRR